MHLARNFRALAGFSDDEIDELVDIAAEAYAEAAGACRPSAPQSLLELRHAWTRSSFYDLHQNWAWFVIIGNGLAGCVGAGRATG